MINIFIIILLALVFVFSTISGEIVKIGLHGVKFELAIITLGMLIGPSFLNLMNYKIFYQMEPLLLMALAWTGMSVGMQLNMNILSKFSWKYFFFTLVEYGVSYAIIILFLLYVNNLQLIPALRISTIHVIAAITAISSPFHIFSNAGRGKEFDLVKFAGSFDGVVAIILFQIILIFDHPYHYFQITHFSVFQLFILVISISIIIGLLLYWAISFKFKKNEFVLLSIGFTLIVGGAAGINLFSPLFVGVVVGFIATNLSSRYFIFSRTLLSGEKPIFFLFLFLAGISMGSIVPFRVTALIVILIVFARLVGKLGGSLIGKTIYSEKQRLNAYLLLVPEGNISLLLAVNYALLFPDINGDLIFAVTVGTYILNQLLGLFLGMGENSK